MLNKELEATLNLAFRNAKAKRHEFMTVEHLLLALLDNTAAVTILHACSADIEALRVNLYNFLEETMPVISDNQLEKEIEPTLAFQRVLQRAVFNVQSSGRSEVSGANILAAVFNEQDSQAVYYLRKENVTRIEVLNLISQSSTPEIKIDNNRHDPFGLSIEESQASVEAQDDPLESYCINLNQKALSNKIDPVIGRDKELQRVAQILCRRRKNNPLLVGEAGVGKTAIAEGLAKAIVDGEVPAVLENSVVYALDLGALLAGTKYRGDFEKRLKSVLAHLSSEKKAVLFIDEIHTIIGAGAASGGVMDASNLIKPLLSSGELKCIGATTYQEYRTIFEKDSALARRFQKIDVKEPSIDETIKILKGLKSKFEKHHNVKFSDASLETAVNLSMRYMHDRFLPDKAIDIIDETGSFYKMSSESKRKKSITPKDVETVVAEMTNIPASKVSQSEKDKLKNLEKSLKDHIYGQDVAIGVLASAIKLSRAGLRESQKPIGSFLFAGPTGVGKTELTQELARNLDVEFMRFDMSEYMEKHSVSRLIGAPPGYVGHDEGGILTEAINKKPYTVLLLDEIEKAHPDIYNILLQIMDYGVLTDTSGRKIDFRNVILILTTNVGASELNKKTMGFTKQDSQPDRDSAINRLFTPEFRNRLDAIVHFASLDRDVVTQVVDKFIIELEHMLVDKGINLVIEDSARSWLAVNGYDPDLGARPMRRLIQEKIKQPLAEHILFGKLKNGGDIVLSAKGDEIIFHGNV